MGRASRRRRELRESPQTAGAEEKLARRAASRAERRATPIGSSLDEYRHIAGISSKRVTEALISRHNKRMSRIGSLQGDLNGELMGVLVSAGSIDLALRRLGASKYRMPSNYAGAWVEQLSWGADSAFQAARLAFSGQFAGACAILRTQLERWTENVAFNADLTHQQGESFGDFAARVWSTANMTYPHKADTALINARERLQDTWEDERKSAKQGEEITVGEDRFVRPAEISDGLSEILHGRGPWAELTSWEAGRLLEGEDTLAQPAAKLLGDAILLNLRQIRVCAATLAADSGNPGLARSLFSMPEILPAGTTAPPPASLMPLMPSTGLAPDVVKMLERGSHLHGQVLAGHRPAGRLYRDDEWVVLSFLERRTRAAQGAMKAFEAERVHLGEEFNIDGVSSKEFFLIMAAETAGLTSNWSSNRYTATALSLSSSSLRSAFWLWLEDDDRAMSLLRVCLEQYARLRIWRTKPEKAQKLEEKGDATPRDWLNNAGLKRLLPFNRALGEFAHAKRNSKWDGARKLLTEIQVDATPETAIYTARGHAMGIISGLIWHESIQHVKMLASDVGMAMEEIFTEHRGEGFDGEMNKWFDHVVQFKDMAFGPGIGED
ncbi:hypothetical protein GCM10010215_43440 [Streptomyces virginiae]|uniref:Uncharacterized protein n=1 Tax=Streptomyces virginiae TaxID=1961 RepID=A0ABQ3NDT5_STRVG|nr:hypothetical protein [Streptomyces virginiae]MBP2346268.1 hypothetical protein [Streptomyces virginiae]GGQ13796.1 hypothetical protein GCM10010215_43440 [Streptomyces virginiae]GHI10955.1 hypothetical protein Scinn_04180 [Streptomyces virginiae]